VVPRGASEQLYPVEYVNDLGILDGTSIRASEMALFRGELPDEVVFLRCLSAHHKGARRINEEAMRMLQQGREYYLLNRREFSEANREQ